MKILALYTSTPCLPFIRQTGQSVRRSCLPFIRQTVTAFLSMNSAVFKSHWDGMFKERIGSNEPRPNYNDLQMEIRPWAEKHQAIQ